MSRSIAAMHVAKKELGLDDETYRAALVQVTGKSSSAAMSEAERQKVLEHFRDRGFKAQSTGSRKRLDGRFVRHGADATKAIEGLKGWLERSGGVDWKAFTDPADCILAAQVRRLGEAFDRQRLVRPAGERTIQELDAAGKQSLMNSLGERIRKLPKAAS